MTSGFLLINKPAGITSHGVVARLRKITGIRKIGHAGTLDPLAEGLMIVALGREATRQIGVFVGLDKVYEAEIVLGAVTESYDLEKEPQATGADPALINEGRIRQVLDSFRGPQTQIPPPHSAIKINGRKLYQFARAGQAVEAPARDIEVFAIELTGIDLPRLAFFCRVSSGTYIRSLADDIGARLGCGAYLARLRRTRVGSYDLSDAIELSVLDKDNWPDFLFKL